jgi:hypothetical protein
MDLFWLIPVIFVGAAFVWVFYLYMRRHPESPSTPHVLVDKPPDQQPEDPEEKQRDWTDRPCGSYLDWLFRESKK